MLLLVGPSRTCSSVIVVIIVLYIKRLLFQKACVILNCKLFIFIRIFTQTKMITSGGHYFGIPSRFPSRYYAITGKLDV